MSLRSKKSLESRDSRGGRGGGVGRRLVREGALSSLMCAVGKRHNGGAQRPRLLDDRSCTSGTKSSVATFMGEDQDRNHVEMMVQKKGGTEEDGGVTTDDDDSVLSTMIDPELIRWQTTWMLTIKKTADKSSSSSRAMIPYKAVVPHKRRESRHDDSEEAYDRNIRKINLGAMPSSPSTSRAPTPIPPPCEVSRVNSLVQDLQKVLLLDDEGGAKAEKEGKEQSLTRSRGRSNSLIQDLQHLLLLEDEEEAKAEEEGNEQTLMPPHGRVNSIIQDLRHLLLLEDEAKAEKEGARGEGRGGGTIARGFEVLEGRDDDIPREVTVPRSSPKSSSSRPKPKSSKPSGSAKKPSSSAKAPTTKQSTKTTVFASSPTRSPVRARAASGTTTLAYIPRTTSVKWVKTILKSSKKKGGNADAAETGNQPRREVTWRLASIARSSSTGIPSIRTESTGTQFSNSEISELLDAYDLDEWADVLQNSLLDCHSLLCDDDELLASEEKHMGFSM